MAKIAITNDVVQEAHGNREVPEIRVWIHPETGSDTYQVFATFQQALDFIKENDEAEDTPLLAFKGMEINLWSIEKE